MTLDIWSILIIIIAFQGLFLLSVLIFSGQIQNKRGTMHLIGIILVLIWFLAEFFAIRNKIDIGLTVFYGTRYGSWFLLGPLTYFYFKSITDTSWHFSRKHVWYFLPFVIFVIVMPFFAYQALDNRQIDYGMLSVFDHREKTLTTVQWMYSIVFILQFVYLGYFLLKNLKVIKSYTKGLKAEYSDVDSKLNWMRYLNIALIILLVLTAIFLYILLITDIYRRHLDYIYVLPIGLLFYFVSYKLVRNQLQTLDNGKKTKYEGSSLDQKLLPNYLDQLNDIIKNDKPYLRADLRLNDLAEILGISRHHLSQILNQHIKAVFF